MSWAPQWALFKPRQTKPGLRRTKVAGLTTNLPFLLRLELLSGVYLELDLTRSPSVLILY